jgi:hypothetical protein
VSVIAIFDHTYDQNGSPTSKHAEGAPRQVGVQFPPSRSIERRAGRANTYSDAKSTADLGRAVLCTRKASAEVEAVVFFPSTKTTPSEWSSHMQFLMVFISDSSVVDD